MVTQQQRLQQLAALLQHMRPAMLQVQGVAPQPAAVQEDGLRPWVLDLQHSVGELRGTLADLGAKHWQLEVHHSEG